MRPADQGRGEEEGDLVEPPDECGEGEGEREDEVEDEEGGEEGGSKLREGASIWACDNNHLRVCIVLSRSKGVTAKKPTCTLTT